MLNQFALIEKFMVTRLVYKDIWVHFWEKSIMMKKNITIWKANSVDA